MKSGDRRRRARFYPTWRDPSRLASIATAISSLSVVVPGCPINRRAPATSAPARCRLAASSGGQTSRRDSLPPDAGSVTHTFPPCRKAMVRAIDRPSPVRLAPLSRAKCAPIEPVEHNGRAPLMPGPESTTSIIAADAAGAPFAGVEIRIKIEPPAGVYFTALSSRITTRRESDSRWPQTATGECGTDSASC